MPDCDDFITCDNSYLTIEDLLRLLIKTDSNGCQAINTIQ